MNVSRRGRWPLLLGAVLVLAACDGENGLRGGQGGGSGPGSMMQAGGPDLRESDTEAPDTFLVTEAGLWDGRPSLGGIWVAHPSVTSPQRVLIRNTTNNREVVGALFRRERDNPGPRLQLSSDAADRLGILAGQPTQLRVVALNRAAPPEPAAPAATLPDEAPVATEEATAEAAADPVAASAAAAIATAEARAAGTEPEAWPEETSLEPQPVPETGSASSFGRRQPRSATADTTLQPVPEDAPPTSFGRRTNRAGAAAAADAPLAAPGELEEIAVETLDGSAAASPATGPATAPAPASGTIQRPFIQAATFGSEANANAAADKLRAAGLSASVRQNGANAWRVLVGPATTAAGQSDLLGRVRAAGYSDAFPVAG
jgi:rare lipoprotein A